MQSIAKSIGIWALALMAVFSLSTMATHAQDATGRILGTVTDPAGSAIQGAKVTVENLATHVSQNVSTGADGFFQAPGLPIGDYRVTIEMDGFRKQIFDSGDLLYGEPLSLYSSHIPFLLPG